MCLGGHHLPARSGSLHAHRHSHWWRLLPATRLQAVPAALRVCLRRAALPLPPASALPAVPASALRAQAPLSPAPAAFPWGGAFMPTPQAGCTGEASGPASAAAGSPASPEINAPLPVGTPARSRNRAGSRLSLRPVSCTGGRAGSHRHSWLRAGRDFRSAHPTGRLPHPTFCVERLWPGPG